MLRDTEKNHLSYCSWKHLGLPCCPGLIINWAPFHSQKFPILEYRLYDTQVKVTLTKIIPSDFKLLNASRDILGFVSLWFCYMSDTVLGTHDPVVRKIRHSPHFQSDRGENWWSNHRNHVQLEQWWMLQERSPWLEEHFSSREIWPCKGQGWIQEQVML